MGLQVQDVYYTDFHRFGYVCLVWRILPSLKATQMRDQGFCPPFLPFPPHLAPFPTVFWAQNDSKMTNFSVILMALDISTYASS